MMKHNQFHKEDFNILRDFVQKVERYDVNISKSNVIMTRFGYYDDENTFYYLDNTGSLYSFIIRRRDATQSYPKTYHASHSHKEYKKQILEKLMYKSAKNGEKKMPRKAAVKKEVKTIIPPVPTITEQTWEDATDEHTLIYKLVFDNGTERLLRFQGQREPEESILVETLLNEEQHMRVIKTNMFEFDNAGDYRRNSRNRLSYQAYRFWCEHNELNWRFAETMRIIGVSERDFIDTLNICTFPFDIFESNYNIIQSGCVVTIDMRIINKSKNNQAYTKTLTYLHGAFNIDVHLEKALENAGVGGVVNVITTEMYGNEVQNNVETFAPSELEVELDELQIGQVLQFEDEKGWTYEGRVAEINTETEIIYIDFNSSWRKDELDIRAEVICIRAATNEELEAGIPFGLISEENESFEDNNE